MEVSKLMLCGNVDEDTPLFILIDIADSMMIDYTKILVKSKRSGTSKDLRITGVDTLIEKIISGPKYLIKAPYTRDMYTYMASMVNSETDWSVDNLTTAYNYSMGFTDKSKYLDLLKDTQILKYGYQDPQNMDNIQPVIIYGMCRYYGIKTKLLTTQDELRLSIDNFIKDKIELRNKIIENINFIDDILLLKAYHLIKELI